MPSQKVLTFVTVEAYNAVKEWMDFRAQHGEKIDGSSYWIVRDLWNLQTDSAVVPRKLQSGGVKRLIRSLWARGSQKDKGRGPRTELGSTVTNFRQRLVSASYFKTACERVMKTLYVEMLMGHDYGLNENYNRPLPIDL